MVDNISVLILAGGLGTRLRPAEPLRPKPVVDINGLPFLYYLLRSLSIHNLGKVCLSIGYKSQIVRDLMDPFRHSLFDSYFEEPTPFGTGGALVEFAKTCSSDKIVYLNGDTFFDKIEDFNFDLPSSFDGKVFSTKRSETDRYGSVLVDEAGSFRGIGNNSIGGGLINLGVGIMRRSFLLEASDLSVPFSIEKDLYPHICNKGSIGVDLVNTSFIDIGVPSDLKLFRDAYA